MILLAVLVSGLVQKVNISLVGHFSPIRQQTIQTSPLLLLQTRMNPTNKNPVHIPFHNVHRSTVKAISTEESKVKLGVKKL